jgi:hypothetical protein
MMEYRVSVVIRTRDVERHLRRLLWTLSRQTLFPSELVVVDNYSSKHKLDAMVRLLSSAKEMFFNNQADVRLITIVDQVFSHAYSTNLGVFAASCDFVCITNGHSLPTSEKWLESGMAQLKALKVAGVAGYSTPHEDGTIWEKLAFKWGWKTINEFSRFYVRDDFFSTVNCVLRKSFWREYPFEEKLLDMVPSTKRFGGEDYDWAMEMLARGYQIVVEPRFDVYHSHGETLPQLVSKYLVWRGIKKQVKSFKRSRKSFTKLEGMTLKTAEKMKGMFI